MMDDQGAGKDSLADEDAAEAAFAFYIDRLQAGDAIHPAEIRRLHPEFGDELLAQLQSYCELSDEPAAAVPPQRLGDFEIVAELGRGGMGVVYEAVQLSLGRRVALKVLPVLGALDERQIRRFQNEAQAAAQLHHASIVPVYAVGCVDGVHYLAMQRLEGSNLREVISALRGERERSAWTAATSHRAISTAPERRDVGMRQDDSRDQRSGPLATVGKPSERLLAGFVTSSKQDLYRTAARLGIQAADALSHAHSHGILHRDIKPSNLIVDQDGRLWVTDFGLAKMLDSPDLTATGDALGTLRYMSPEQLAEPAAVDQRSDVYSLGATLYEFLAKQPIFPDASREELSYLVLHSEPKPLCQIDAEIPRDLGAIIRKALERDRRDRYDNAQQLADDLRRFLDHRPTRARPVTRWHRGLKWCRRNKLKTAFWASVFASVALLGLLVSQHRREQQSREDLAWVRSEAIPAIREYVKQETFIPAFQLLQRAEAIAPDDHDLEQLAEEVATPLEIVCNVDDVEVSIQRYGSDDEWFYLGRTPFPKVRVPVGHYRWRAIKDGYVTREMFREISLDRKPLEFDMYPPSKCPPGMIPMASEQVKVWAAESKRLVLPFFFIDQFEVTNSEYQEFVDQGGYEREEFWVEPFRDGDTLLTFDQARERFRDQTGRFGPSTWSRGRFPEGRERYPVAGVSWYEAAAYARFRKKCLPSVYHWNAGADFGLAAVNLELSNLDGEGPAEVGAFRAVSEDGLYDTAGNVREWCYNAAAGDTGQRAAAGGAWEDPLYAFKWTMPYSPWQRDPAIGFRCVNYPDGEQALPEGCLDAIDFAYPIDHRARKPVSASELDVYKRELFFYEKTDLSVTVKTLEENRSSVLEEVTLSTVYDDDRIRSLVWIPRQFKPPYQPVIFLYGASAVRLDHVEHHPYKKLRFLVDSGRMLVLPELFGQYDRPRAGHEQGLKLFQQETCIKRTKDVMRIIDYLETRSDVDVDKVTFFGTSSSAQHGPTFLAVEHRFHTGILANGGLPRSERLPSCDPFNFAPRVVAPVLMLNGKDDYIFPLDESQRPLFDLLGTPPEHKRHILYPGGHGLFSHFIRQSRVDVLQWLDHYCGKPEEN